MHLRYPSPLPTGWLPPLRACYRWSDIKSGHITRKASRFRFAWRSIRHISLRDSHPVSVNRPKRRAELWGVHTVKAGSCELSGSGYKRRFQNWNISGSTEIISAGVHQIPSPPAGSRAISECRRYRRDRGDAYSGYDRQTLFLEKVPGQVHVLLERILILLQTPAHLFSPKGGPSSYDRCGSQRSAQDRKSE
jgi:hypothetical protein